MATGGRKMLDDDALIEDYDNLCKELDELIRKDELLKEAA
jgi:hypothetical protein